MDDDDDDDDDDDRELLHAKISPTIVASSEKEILSISGRTVSLRQVGSVRVNPTLTAAAAVVSRLTVGCIDTALKTIVCISYIVLRSTCEPSVLDHLPSYSAF